MYGELLIYLAANLFSNLRRLFLCQTGGAPSRDEAVMDNGGATHMA